MYLFGQRKNSKSYKRWKGKYSIGRKYYMSRKRKFKSRTTSNRGPSNKYLLNEIRKLKTGASGKEYKFHDRNTDADATTTGELFNLSLIAQGDTSTTREALVIRLLSLKMRLHLTSDFRAETGGNFVRVILFYDTELSGVYPTVAQILEEDSVLAWKEKHVNRGRFKFLYDKRFSLNIKVADTNIDVFPKEYYKKFGKYAPKINYLGTAATEANSGKNNLFLYVLGNDDNYPANVSFNVRLRYTG